MNPEGRQGGSEATVSGTLHATLVTQSNIYSFLNLLYGFNVPPPPEINLNTVTISSTQTSP